MRSLEDIDSDLAAAREELSHAQGTPAEVYSRIVGYYRSVRNWNRGKREEYGERKMFCVPEDSAACTGSPAAERRAVNKDAVFGVTAAAAPKPAVFRCPGGADRKERLLLFVRPACPACPGANAAAGRLGIPVDLVNADTEDGMAEAVKRQVFSTPTAILLAHDGRELGRAQDAGSIGRLAAV
jgi:ribonucleoside-triphosphate reductase